jgi:putative SOS response-associated peptidase YedK
MPVILDPAAYDQWLDLGVQGSSAKAVLVDNQIDSDLEFFRVGREVNNSRYEGTDTKKPIINSL